MFDILEGTVREFLSIGILCCPVKFCKICSKGFLRQFDDNHTMLTTVKL